MSDSAGSAEREEHRPKDTHTEESTRAPLAPEDFYYENGLLVFTAVYHLKRGYCCNSGCRHCPFR
jgi:Family of unknown function (DUF5522)